MEKHFFSLYVEIQSSVANPPLFFSWLACNNRIQYYFLKNEETETAYCACTFRVQVKFLKTSLFVRSSCVYLFGPFFPV